MGCGVGLAGTGVGFGVTCGTAVGVGRPGRVGCTVACGVAVATGVVGVLGRAGAFFFLAGRFASDGIAAEGGRFRWEPASRRSSSAARTWLRLTSAARAASWLRARWSLRAALAKRAK